MELQFETMSLPCLRRVVLQRQSAEQTQELKLPDGFPDIGRTLGAWGQVILRSKQWNVDNMQISGGVTMQAMYAPEDGSEPRCLETWIPFSMKWELPRSDREGIIHVKPQIISMDIRTLSARKLMARVNVGAVGHAMMPEDIKIPVSPEKQAGIEMRTRRYPMLLPREAGEKNFFVDEDMPVKLHDGSAKLLSCTVEPSVTEAKVVGDKIAFRGHLHVHAVAQNVEGRIESWHGDQPFSQYTELDRDYGNDSKSSVVCCATSLESEMREDGTLHVKCGLVGQYRITEEKMVELPEDGYSLERQLKLKKEQVAVPAILEQRENTVSAQQQTNLTGIEIADVQFCPDIPQIHNMGDEVQIQLGGNFSLLYYDGENVLQYAIYRWQEDCSIPAGDGGEISATLYPADTVQVTNGSAVTLRCDMTEKLCVYAVENMETVVSMDIGDAVEKDPFRPSIILERMGQGDLWDLAKRCGSTVDAIMSVNNLDSEPEENRMLLIPVL